MKIELLFTMYDRVTYSSSILRLGKFPTKKSAYLYVKNNRKFFVAGHFTLCIYKRGDYVFERVNFQDTLHI